MAEERREGPPGLPRPKIISNLPSKDQQPQPQPQVRPGTQSGDRLISNPITQRPGDCRPGEQPHIAPVLATNSSKLTTPQTSTPIARPDARKVRRSRGSNRTTVGRAVQVQSVARPPLVQNYESFNLVLGEAPQPQPVHQPYTYTPPTRRPQNSAALPSLSSNYTQPTAPLGPQSIVAPLSVHQQQALRQPYTYTPPIRRFGPQSSVANPSQASQSQAYPALSSIYNSPTRPQQQALRQPYIYHPPTGRFGPQPSVANPSQAYPALSSIYNPPNLPQQQALRQPYIYHPPTGRFGPQSSVANPSQARPYRLVNCTPQIGPLRPPPTLGSRSDAPVDLTGDEDISSGNTRYQRNTSTRKMAGKKSGKALKREEGLERTDNGLKQTSWPEPVTINQKNYYTDYMKRDSQILTQRLQNERNLENMVKQARDRDRALARPDAQNPNAEPDMEDEGVGMNGSFDASKVIVIHPGSQNIRIGLATDALPKTVPMCLASKSPLTESDLYEPLPKRQKQDAAADQQFGEEFSKQLAKAGNELKIDMRANKRKVLPNSKELIVNYNKRTPPEKIPEHNDPLRIEWTDVEKDDKDDIASCFTGVEAQRVPDDSKPPYMLSWPMQHGVLNEKVYNTAEMLYDDFESIIENCLRKDLGLNSSIAWEQYSVIVVVPDLYDKKYIEQILQMCLRNFVFKQITLMQESLASSFGAGYSTTCIVDIGAQKTSIACVEDGMIIEDSRVNLKYGGYDVTETYIKMMLHDYFPYQEINLMRRYDFLLAEELKIASCTMNQVEVATRGHTFHLRVPNKPTQKYSYKTYDEVYLAPMGFFDPTFFDHSEKLKGRRKLIKRSYNPYDPDMPDDPTSAAQLEILASIKPSLAQPTFGGLSLNGNSNGDISTPQKEKPNPFNHLSRMDSQANGDSRVTSAAASPAPEGTNTPSLGPTISFGAGGTNGGSPGPSMFHFGNGSHNSGTPGPPAGIFIDPLARTAEDIAIDRESVLPVAPLDTAILTSIMHAAKGDDKKSRDFLGGIMVVGGGAKTPGLISFLEEKLKARRPDLADKILVGTSPKDMDVQVVAWKGGSVLARGSLHESWVGQLEYERLGVRALHGKALWPY